MSDDVKVITNNVPRDVVYGCEVGPEVRAEFDYILWDKVDNLESNPEFVKYKGEWYHLQDFMVVPQWNMDWAQGWSGYASDSFFSGVLVKYVGSDCEQVIMGRYYS